MKPIMENYEGVVFYPTDEDEAQEFWDEFGAVPMVFPPVWPWIGTPESVCLCGTVHGAFETVDHPVVTQLDVIHKQIRDRDKEAT